MMPEMTTIVLAGLQRDGITAEKARELTGDQWQELIMAYVESETKRFEKFATKYRTNGTLKELFRNMVVYELIDAD